MGYIGSMDYYLTINFYHLLFLKIDFFSCYSGHYIVRQTSSLTACFLKLYEVPFKTNKVDNLLQQKMST